MHRFLLSFLLVPVLLWAIVPANGALTLENRNRATFPDWPMSLSEVSGFLAGVEAYVADNIGLRDQLIAVKTRVDYLVNGRANDRVIAGVDGWLFYNAPEIVDRSSGLQFSPERVENMIRFATEAYDLAQSVGAKGFVVVPVPNSHSVYSKHLPAWARPESENPKTEQRAIAEGLKVTGMAVTDPYLLFKARNLDQQPLYFQRDTHWNDFGAYIAFYDAMTQIGQQSSFPKPDTILKGYFEGEYYGVLDQFLGLKQAAGSEPLPDLDRTIFEQSPERSVTEYDNHVSMDSFEVTYSTKGPRLLVIGDSFSYGFFRKFWGAGFSAVHWSHHDYGRYDRAFFQSFRPDYVIFEFVDWEVPAWVPFNARFQ